MEAADGWGEGEALRGVLAASELLARGPKACGALRAAGLREAWSPRLGILQRSPRTAARPRRPGRPAHRRPTPRRAAARLPRRAARGAGAEVVPVPVYRWTGPLDPGPLDRLLDAVLSGGVDALTFTSALAAAGLYARAEERGAADDLTRVLRGRTQVACVGPVTAAPLLARDIPAYWPERFRVGALVRLLGERLPATAPVLPAAGHTLEVRGTAVLLDGELRPVSPGPMAVLRVLARRPGAVVSCADLLGVPARRGGDRRACRRGCCCPTARGSRGALCGADRHQTRVPYRPRSGGGLRFLTAPPSCGGAVSPFCGVRSPSRGPVGCSPGAAPLSGASPPSPLVLAGRASGRLLPQTSSGGTPTRRPPASGLRPLGPPAAVV